ncbi:unnamed protein product, partial [Closterium sp. NIES-53]
MLAGSVMAVEAINSDPSILPHHRLHLATANYSMTAPIASMMAAYSLVRQRPVAVIGPHTSEQAALVSPFATTTQVPFVSASATDAQLTVGGTRPFFMRTVQDDGHQMRAIADARHCWYAALTRALPLPLYLPSCTALSLQLLVTTAQLTWKAFIAIHSDDRYGGNGITALEACVLALNQGISMAHRVAITPGSTAVEVEQHLQLLLEVDTAVYVLHASAAVATSVILAANRLGLFSANNVWIATEGSALLTGSALHYAQGMIVTATDIPTSAPLTAFVSKWLTLDPVRFPNVSRQMPMAYALASHDAVYLIAHALHSILYNSSSAGSSTNASSPDASTTPTEPHRNLTDLLDTPWPTLHLSLASSSSSGAEPALIPPLALLHRSPLGSMLRAAILSTRFEGASGSISLSPQGDQQSNLTRILNVHRQASQSSTPAATDPATAATTDAAAATTTTTDAAAVAGSNASAGQSAPPPAATDQSSQSTESPTDATDSATGSGSGSGSGSLSGSSTGSLGGSVTGPVSLQGNVEVVPVGYWSPMHGLYQTAAASENATAGGVQQPVNIVFPDGLTQPPRGAFPKRRVRIAVPKKLIYLQFANISADESLGNDRFSGYCVDLFRLAVARLPYKLDYEFVEYTGALISYTQMVQAVQNKEFDGAVGDITVVDSRQRMVYFTQSILQSGLSLIGYSRESSDMWTAFLPFTPSMWTTLLGLSLLTGALMVFLEWRLNIHFQAKLHQLAITAAWFGLHTLYSVIVYSIRSVLARTVLGMWLILAFLFLASYTSNLTAILTIQRLTPTILDITTAINSNAAIGYQQASFVSSYLQQLGVSPDKLETLSGESEYASSLASGRVAVIVDENPYLAIFTSQFCDVMQAAQPFSSLNLAFAFQKGSSLGQDISNAIGALRMTQEVEKLHAKYFSSESVCPQKTTAVQFGIQRFGGLYIIYLVVSTACCIIYVALLIYRGYRYVREKGVQSLVDKVKSFGREPPGGSTEEGVDLSSRWAAVEQPARDEETTKSDAPLPLLFSSPPLLRARSFIAPLQINPSSSSSLHSSLGVPRNTNSSSPSSLSQPSRTTRAASRPCSNSSVLHALLSSSQSSAPASQSSLSGLKQEKEQEQQPQQQQQQHLKGLPEATSAVPPAPAPSAAPSPAPAPAPAPAHAPGPVLAAVSSSESTAASSSRPPRHPQPILSRVSHSSLGSKRSRGSHDGQQDESAADELSRRRVAHSNKTSLGEAVSYKGEASTNKQAGGKEAAGGEEQGGMDKEHLPPSHLDTHAYASTASSTAISPTRSTHSSLSSQESSSRTNSSSATQILKLPRLTSIVPRLPSSEYIFPTNRSLPTSTPATQPSFELPSLPPASTLPAFPSLPSLGSTELPRMESFHTKVDSLVDKFHKVSSQGHLRDIPEQVATDVIAHAANSAFNVNSDRDANADSDLNANTNLTVNTDRNRVLLSHANSISGVNGHDSSNGFSANGHDECTNASVSVRMLASDGGTKIDARRRKAVAGRSSSNDKSKAVLTVGCLFAPDMPGGIDMLAASVMAVEEINGDPSILPNHVLHLTVQNYSVASLTSQLTAFKLLENHPVAVIGPHTSDQAARFSPLAAATQVPFISASATDVQLTQGASRPFFMRAVASDGVQMAAMAELIRRYKWQQVALIYSDDRFGRNGVTALALQLLSIHAEADVAARVAIPLSATDKAIHQHMSALKSLDVAVYVLHTSPIIVSAVVAAANKLHLFARNSVWISSEAAAVISATSTQQVDGLIITATHVPPSSRLSAFFDRWKLLNASQYLGLTKGSPSPYALPSYDAVTLVARALHSLLYPSAPASNSSSPNKPSQAQQQKLGQQQVGQQQEGQHKKMGQQRRSQQQKAGQQQQQEGWAQAFQQLELPVLPLLSNGTQDMLAPPLTRLQQSAMGSALRKALLKTSFDGLQG